MCGGVCGRTVREGACTHREHFDAHNARGPVRFDHPGPTVVQRKVVGAPAPRVTGAVGASRKPGGGRRPECAFHRPEQKEAGGDRECERWG